MDETYRVKERRDKRAAELRAIGVQFKLTSSTGDILSPDYVRDACEDGLTRACYCPNGFGGLSAQRWGKLWHIEFS